MTFYQRNGVFKKQVLSDEKLITVSKFHKADLDIYCYIYGITDLEECIRFLFEINRDFVEVYEMGRHIDRIEFKEVGDEYYCRAYLN